MLSFEKLMLIADLIREYFPENETIGCFSRITDISLKTDEELLLLHDAGYTGLTIGVETGDDKALDFMNKGYSSKDIIEQCRRLEYAGISYNFFYLTGISGSGNGEKGALATAAICNQLHPELIGANMLTVYPDSELYQEIQNGNWKEESELEKYRELKILIANLKLPTVFAAMGASNAIQLQGILPGDKEKLLSALTEITNTISEEELRRYRNSLKTL